MGSSSIDRRTLGKLALVGVAALTGCKREATCVPGAVDASTASARSALKYVAESPDPTKYCEDCVQYTPPKESGCGGCKVLAGPIQARGTCVAFSKKG